MPLPSVTNLPLSGRGMSDRSLRAFPVFSGRASRPSAPLSVLSVPSPGNGVLSGG